MKCGNNGEKPTCDQVKELEKIMSKMPDDEEVYQDSEMIKALADPTRLKIVYLLRSGELCVCEIMEALEKPQATVSHHLNILKNAGFLKWRKEGVWTHYRLSNSKIPDNLKELLENR
jgi:DNA-binding transcriptional ArsR family regulator